MRKSDKWFTIIELLVWIFIFSMGLLSIYFTIHQSIKLNDMSRDNIIASNLAREWIELVKNTRDSNYSTIHAWNSKNPLQSGEINDSDKFGTGGSSEYYKISNNFNTSEHSVKFEEIIPFREWKDKLADMETYRLYLDNKGRYVYNNGASDFKATSFYRYVEIEPAHYEEADGSDTYIDGVIVTSKVIWVHRDYHETEIKSVLTNWMRQ